MKIGSARYCLSPQKEFFLIGYRSDNRYEPAGGIHDDIYCQSLLFENDKKQVFLFSADFIEFEEEMAEEVKTKLYDLYGINRDCVLLCAAHNHSSIASYHKKWYTGHFDQEYYDFVIKIILESYQTCQSNLQVATAKYGKEKINGYYSNRNHPGQEADQEVIVLKFFDQNEKPFAGLINWAVHSTVISADNIYLTSELAGHVRDKLFHHFGFYPAMIVGAAADCSNRNERQGNNFQELERVSTLLSQDIAKIEINQNVVMNDILCQTIFHTIHHHMEFVHEDIKKEIHKYNKQMNDKNQVFIQKKIDELAHKLNIQLFDLDVKASVISLGEIQLFVFPGELASQFGIDLKKQYSGLAIICGYTNGYYGYFMPKEEYGLSFETIGTCIPKGEPEKIVDKMRQASYLLARKE